MFNKLDELDDLIATNYDIIMLNETKLDSNVPHSFYLNSNYNILRRDRNRHGGGIIVFIRREYYFTREPDFDNIEAIHFKLKINDFRYNFIATYKPPVFNNNCFLDEIETRISSIAQNLPIFIIGDLNMDLNSSKGDELTSFMKNNNFFNFVKNSTRTCTRFYSSTESYQTSESLLDVILHNADFVTKTDTFGCPFSDHDIVACCLNIKPSKPVQFYIILRNLCHNNLNIINNDLSLLNLDDQLNYSTPNENWIFLKQEISQILDKVSPEKKLIKSFKTKFPWSDAELHAHKKIRDSLYRTYKLNLNYESHLEYKAAKALYQSMKRSKIVNYFKSFEKINDFKNSKSYWKFHSSSINIKSNKEKLTNLTLNINDKVINDDQEIAESFNTFFTSLDSSSTANYDECLLKIDLNFAHLKQSNIIKTGNFEFSCVSESYVSQLIDNLDAHTSPGVSGIPAKVIKYSDALVRSFTNIINQCILNKTIPNEWKAAVVTPLFKRKGNSDEVNNYRGISVISPIAKIFEKVLSSQIIDYINEQNILTTDQHGFRTNHSCETALHELITDLNLARNNKLSTLLLFIDFRKAFDLVESPLLLRKLEHLGFSSNALDLVKNYFTNRTQIVKYKDQTSSEANLKLGVPQGSILGPLFFTLFINDLAYLLSDLKKKLFADDTTFYRSDKDCPKLIKDFQQLIKPLLNWCDTNKLDLNWSKTYFLFIKNKRITYPSFINIAGNQVEVVDSFKLLGINIDSRLKFNDFINSTKKSVNIKLYSIKKLFYLSNNVKIQSFKSFILPYFNFCLTLSLYFPKATLQRLCNFYYLCIYKLFKFKPSSDHIANYILLAKLSLQSFHHLLILRFGSFFHKILNNINSPVNLKSLILKKQSYNYNLRSNNDLFQRTSINNHYGEHTVQFFFSKFSNLFFYDEFYQPFDFFILRLNNNINLLISKFTKEFFNFDLIIKNFDYLDSY